LEWHVSRMGKGGRDNLVELGVDEKILKTYLKEILHKGAD